MGGATPVIRSVSTPAYGRVTIEAGNGKRYSADLMRFRSVPCFPPDVDAWSKLWIDSYGLALVWACRFEVHADQVIGLADRVENIDAAT